MLIVTGMVLVLVTWAALAVVLGLAGLLPAIALQLGPVRWSTVARALWWGLLLMTLAVYVVAFRWPLQSSASGAGLACIAVVLAVCGLVAARRRGIRLSSTTGRGFWIVTAACCVAVVALAAAALGPVTNIDSGLYHLGAIGYAADYAAVPGLSNLYGPLGYGTAEFPLAAVLGNGPWGQDGLRLLNGLIITLAAADLVLRFTRRRTSAGRGVMVVGAGVLLISMVALADYWVTSPTQDSSVFALTVVATAYLADALIRRSTVSADGATAVAVAIMTVLLRPTMAVFTLVLGAVLVVRIVSWRRQGSIQRLPMAVTLSVLSGIAAAALATARDYVLSGWLQYPLSFLAFDVAWRAPDPTPLREATLGYHRNPADIWGSTTGWQWVGPWATRALHQWETWLALLLALGALVLLVAAARVTTFRWRSLLLCVLPSAAATAAWWVASPPSFRFAWGPVFTMLTIPCGWALWRLTTSRVPRARSWRGAMVGAFALAVAGVSLFTLVVRTEWSEMTTRREWQMGLSIPYAVAPLRVPPVAETTLASGLTVLVPVEDELCWSVFPLCTPQVASTVRLAGPTLQEGFLP